MAKSNSKKSARGRTTEAKLLITAASIAATLSGLAMFATQNAETLAQNQSAVVVTVPEDFAADEYSPPVEATPAPVTGRTRGTRGLRSQQGTPNSLGTTRSSR